MARARLSTGIEHQDRDIDILRDLYVSRIMTRAHVAALHFGGRNDAAKKRLQKLTAAALVRERPRKARDPGILFLAKRGFETLHDRGAVADLPSLSWKAFERRAAVSPLTLRHELEVMNVKAALAPAIAKHPRLSLIEFTTWPLLCEFTTRPPHNARNYDPVRVRPDGMIRVLERGEDDATFEHAFFLEVDRGTETLDTLALRIVCYREHYSGGGYAASLGADRNAVADYPFRVLMVFPSEERRNNAAERFLQIQPAIETMAWMTTMPDVANDPLGAIWIRPRDFRQATLGTPYAPSARPERVYRRRVDREAHVRAALTPLPLFDDSPTLAPSDSSTPAMTI
jgi:hypothetical protein